MRQKQALTVLMSGSNVFLTGSPGTGKTFVLNQFIDWAHKNGKQIAITASTGIAASQINGTTIHSWSGLGILDQLSKNDLEQYRQNDRLKKRYNNTDILIIDEVSMLHGQRLNMVDQLARTLRENEQPFGGMQVILAGDLFQLPPVSRGQNTFDFMHESSAWHSLDSNIAYLEEQYRQLQYDKLLSILEAMRSGDMLDEHIELLRSRLNQTLPSDQIITRLYSHNLDVDTINRKHLEKLSDKSYFFKMQTKGRAAKVEQLGKTLLVPEIVELKIGAEIMFVANNFSTGYVNGTRGKIIHFDNDIPVVETTGGKHIYVEPNTWSLTEDGNVKAEITQLPIRLAWAVTIHKSQGMSLDAAEIDLSRAFTPGMGYVALSRVRSINGLYLNGINQMALTMNSQIFEVDKLFRQASNLLADTVSDVTDEELQSEAADQIVDTQLFEALKKWRLERATNDNIPPYLVAHNTALLDIARHRPETSKDLLRIHGIGERKIELYGPELLSVVKKSQS